MSTAVSLLSGAAVGAILAALIRARFEREHEWRKSLSEAAAEYASRVAGASNAVRYALGLVETAHRGEPRASGAGNGNIETAVNEANHLTNEIVVSLARVQLLFFRDPSAQKAATEAFESLRAAAEGLRASRDLEGARALYERAESESEQFKTLVSQSLRRSIWLAA